jgi:3-phosphoshikimate 1-carboxyvinyltransferase
MKTVEKMSRRDVKVAAPPAKAHTLRALFMAALAEGRSELVEPLMGEDQRHAIDCLRALGAGIEIGEGRVTVEGTAGELHPSIPTLDVGESGVTMNFLTAVACLADEPVVLDGVPRIRQRPIAEIAAGMRQLGCRIEHLQEDGFPPVRVVAGGIPGGTARMSGAIISQYFSAMLTAAPYSRDEVTVECTDEMTEKPYLDITISMMHEFGIDVERDGYAWFRVPNGIPYRGRLLRIEGDYSSASFFFAAAAVCGATVTVTNLNHDSVQGDRRFLDLIAEMGCQVGAIEDGYVVTGGELRAIEADMRDVPDLVPPLAVAAAFADGETRLTNIGQLRHKECDRLAVMASELGKMGVRALCDETSLTIVGGEPQGASIDPHNDHRIAMSFAVAGLATGSQTIQDETCVAKSFPDFWERLEAFR